MIFVPVYKWPISQLRQTSIHHDEMIFFTFSIHTDNLSEQLLDKLNHRFLSCTHSLIFCSVTFRSVYSLTNFCNVHSNLHIFYSQITIIMICDNFRCLCLNHLFVRIRFAIPQKCNWGTLGSDESAVICCESKLRVI